MNENRKLEILRLLQRVLVPSEPKTLRVLGLSVEEAHELASEHLVSLGDSNQGEPLDRLCCIELLDAAEVLLARHDMQHEPVHKVNIVPVKQRLFAKLGKGIVTIMWDLTKIGFGVALGWYLTKRFG